MKLLLTITAMLILTTAQAETSNPNIRIIRVTQDTLIGVDKDFAQKNLQTATKAQSNLGLEHQMENEVLEHFVFQEGSLKDNVNRAKEFFGVDVLVWSPSIPECVDWNVTSSYTLKSPYMMDALAEMLEQYELIPKYHSTGNVLQILTNNKYKACTDV